MLLFVTLIEDNIYCTLKPLSQENWLTKHNLVAIRATYKYKGDKDPYYNTKILIFSFTWAGLAAFFMQFRQNLMKVVQSSTMYLLAKV